MERNKIRHKMIMKENSKLNQYMASVYVSGKTFKINEIYSLDNIVEKP